MHMWWTELWLNLDVWNGSHSCSGVQWEPDVIPSTCQKNDYIPSTPRLELAFIWCISSVYTSTYSVIQICTEYVLVCTLFLKLRMRRLCRIQYWLFLHTVERLDSARKSSDKRRKETREGRKRDGAWMAREMKCESDRCKYVLVQHKYIQVCTGTNNASLNIWEQTFILLRTIAGDTWRLGQVNGGKKEWL